MKKVKRRMLYELASTVRRIAEQAGSEAKLQVQLEPLLRGLLMQHDIPYEPSINESLKSLGFSQVNSTRPDSLFGHVVLDYKEPGVLTSHSGLPKAKRQIEGYLNNVSGSHSQHAEECSKWAGVLWDGYNLAFCRSNGTEWQWTKVYETSEASLLTLLQIYRSLQREPLNAGLLSKYFGKSSGVARSAISVLCNHLSHPKHRTTLLFQEWRRLFQQVSTYTLSELPSLREWARQTGLPTRDASQILFALHTYYSIVVKLLTAELLSAGNLPVSGSTSLAQDIANASSDDIVFQKIAQLENSDFYRRFRISNFLEGDFFSWYCTEQSSALASAIVEIARTFLKFEPATAKLRPDTVKDLLKEFYSGLVDEQIRHDLGEYYTPDWLAQYLLDKVGYLGQPWEVVLDPACGSGTFLVECITRLRTKCEELGYDPLEILSTVLKTVKGMDLNPLAVISARANYILAVADLVFSLGEIVEIPVYLADAINVPVEQAGGILQYTLDTEVRQFNFEMPVCLVRRQVLGQLLLKCEDYIKHGRTVDEFVVAMRRMPELQGLLDTPTENRLRIFYSAIDELNNRTPPWDSIWCRIVKNNFSPKGFEKADYIVGNPPWVRWSRLPETYRSRVQRFCNHYGLVSGRSYTGGIESDISTVVVFSVVDHWLKEGGKIGFLMPWPVFKSSSARGFRLGALPDGSGLRMVEIEDLSAIQCFPDATNATSIYIAKRVASAQKAEFKAIPCQVWQPIESARIDPACQLDEVMKQINILPGQACPVSEFGSPLFTGGRAKYRRASQLRGRSSYVDLAHRGTVNDLSRVYWVKVEKYVPSTNRALIRTLTRHELSKARIVEPCEAAWIEADVLFPLLRGREVGKYSFDWSGWYQIVPNRHYSNFEKEEDFAADKMAAYSYLLSYKDLLPKRATYRRYLKNLPIYSIYCVGDYSFAPWKVVWPEQQDAGRFRAAVIAKVESGAVIPDRIFVPDHKLYFVGTDDPMEAHYLCAFLNSAPVSEWLGGFLLDAQIGTTVFEYMHVPQYSPANPAHRRMAEISVAAHTDRQSGRIDEPLPKQQEQELSQLVQLIARGAAP